MALKQRIQDDLKTALLGGDSFAVETLRGLKAAILNEEVAKNKRDDGLEDSEIEQVAAKEVKKRNEAAVLYDQNDRQESADEERRQAEIIGSYLPKQLSQQELKTVVDAKIAEIGATDMKMMGQVIGAVKQEVGTSADGAMVADLVKQALK